MGMSTHVLGIRPPDEKWRKMKQVYESCIEMDVEIPPEVWKFFNDEEPDDKGVRVEIPHEDWGDESSEGLEIDVAKIPADVKIIRFYNSW